MSDHIQTSAIPGWIISTVRTHPKAPGVYQGTEDCSSETEVSKMHIEKHFPKGWKGFWSVNILAIRIKGQVKGH